MLRTATRSLKEAGTGETLGWPVAHDSDPHIPVWDRGKREDGSFSRPGFIYDRERDRYICPGAKLLKTTGRLHSDNIHRDIASTVDCDACAEYQPGSDIQTAGPGVLKTEITLSRSS